MVLRPSYESGSMPNGSEMYLTRPPPGRASLANADGFGPVIACIRPSPKVTFERANPIRIVRTDLAGRLRAAKPEEAAEVTGAGGEAVGRAGRIPAEVTPIPAAEDAP